MSLPTEITDKLQSFIDTWTKGVQVIADTLFPSDDDNANKSFYQSNSLYAYCIYRAPLGSYTNIPMSNSLYFAIDVNLNNNAVTVGGITYLGKDNNNWTDANIQLLKDNVTADTFFVTVDGTGKIVARIGSDALLSKYDNGVYYNNAVHFHCDKSGTSYGATVTNGLSIRFGQLTYTINSNGVCTPSQSFAATHPSSSNNVLYAINSYPVIGYSNDVNNINTFVSTQGATHNYTTTYTTPENKTITVYYGDNYIITHTDDNEPVSYNDIQNALNIAVNKINDDNETNIKVPTYDDNKYGDNVDKNHTKPMSLTKFVPDANGMVYYYELDKDDVWKVRSGLNTINLDVTVLKDVTRNLISYKIFAFSPTALIKTKTPVIVHIGGREIKYNGDSIPANYVEELNTIALGSINISKLFGDYRDYAPYTKIELFVPFCGWTTLPSWCIDTTITGELFVDMWNGSCKAVIKASALDAPDGVVVCEMGGVCAYDVPFVADATGAKAASLLSKVATTAGAVATGNPLAIATSGISLATALNENYTRMMGVVGDGSNINGLDHMFVKLTRVSWTDAHRKERPDAYKHMHGIPCGKQLTLTAGDGFTQIHDATITGAMTDREKQMIIDGFKHGLIL